MFPPKLHSQHRRSWTLRLLHPLLAFVYTNTHLLGQGRLGENYNTLIYETPGRPKARRPRLVRPCFLLSWTLDIWNMTLTFKAVTFSQSLTRTRLSQWAQLLTTDNPLVNHCGTFGSDRPGGPWLRRGVLWKVQRCSSSLWLPHFLQCEGAVIRHLGTIVQSWSRLLTPAHALLIRLTFRNLQE